MQTTGGATYTAWQLPQLLNDLGLHQQAAVYPTVRKLNELDRADFQARAASCLLQSRAGAIIFM